MKRSVIFQTRSGVGQESGQCALPGDGTVGRRGCLLQAGAVKRRRGVGAKGGAEDGKKKRNGKWKIIRKVKKRKWK